MVAKTTPPPTSPTAGQGVPGTGTPTRQVPPPPKPKPASSGTSHWLDTLQDVKVGQPDQPQRPKVPPTPTNREQQERTEQRGPGDYRDERGPRSYDDRSSGGYRDNVNRGPGTYREGGYRGPGGYRENESRSPGGYRVGGGSGLPSTIGPRPRQPMEGGPDRGPRPGGPGENRGEKFRPGGRKEGKPAGKTKTPKPPAPPKPKREKIPPPAPFKPTPEQIAQVEARYTELAQPAEYDGIRSQISTELGIPKTAVKKIIKEFREREGIPSWWELQSYKGDAEELAKIRALYEPYLPLPPVGIHKKIAEELSLKPGEVYQAIKAIRLEMNLPQFNDPALHGLELKPRGKKEPPAEEQKTELAESTQEVTPEEQKTESVEPTQEVTAEEQKTESAEPTQEVTPSTTDTSTPPTSSADDEKTEPIPAVVTDTDKAPEE